VFGDKWLFLLPNHVKALKNTTKPKHRIINSVITQLRMLAHTHTPFNDPFSGTTRVGWYQKGKTNLDFTEARDSEWQLHQLGYMQACTSLQTDNHASTSPFSFLQAGCPSCRPTNSVKALKANACNRSKTRSSRQVGHRTPQSGSKHAFRQTEKLKT